MAILSTGISRRMRDKRTLVSLFHSHMLSLAVLETLSKESDEVKSLLQRSILNLEDFLFELGRDFSVGSNKIYVKRHFWNFVLIVQKRKEI